jgi:hypothetical protein
MNTLSVRSQLVESALTVTRCESIAPGPYERWLLTEYVQGVLTIGQVIELLEGHTEGKLLSLVLAENVSFWEAA